MHGKLVTLVAMFRIDGNNTSLMALVKSNAYGIRTVGASFSLPKADAYLSLVKVLV